MKQLLKLFSLGLLLPLISSCCCNWCGPSCEESYCVYEPQCPTPNCYYEPCCPGQCVVPYEERAQNDNCNRNNCEASCWNKPFLRNY